jgi:hypothetical protein
MVCLVVSCKLIMADGGVKEGEIWRRLDEKMTLARRIFSSMVFY